MSRIFNINVAPHLRAGSRFYRSGTVDHPLTEAVSIWRSLGDHIVISRPDGQVETPFPKFNSWRGLECE